MKVQDPVKYQIRKESILRQARHLFATKGYEETSMDDIARAHHIQKASLYHYFKSKQKILEDMIRLEASRWVSQNYAVTDGLRESLKLFGFSFLNYVDDPGGREFFKIIQFESHKNPVIFKAFKENPVYKRGPLYRLLLDHLGNKLSQRQIAMLATQFIGGLIHYIALSRMRGENMCLEKFTDQEYVGQLVNIFMKGIGEG